MSQNRSLYGYKQRSTKHTHKAKDRVTRPQLTPTVNSGAPQR
jgi:hypothetical protein